MLAVVSSEKQSETLPHQIQWARETAAAHGWRLERLEDFQDVSTGKYGPRRLVRKLLADIRALRADERPAWVLMLRLDRVGRGSIVESQIVVHELKQLGVRVWTRDQGEIKLDSAMEQLMVAMQSAVATHENEVKSEKAIAAHQRKKKAGLHTGGVAYGFANIDNRLIPHEPEASFIRELFSMRIQGNGFSRLAKFAKRNAPPKPTRDGPKELAWTIATMHRLISNRAYRGAIVPEDVFDAAQERAGTGINMGPIHDYPLRGAIRCSCETMLSASFAGSRRHRVRYYLCRNSVHDRYPYHNADHLEREFVDLLRRLCAHPELLASNVDTEPLEQRIETVRAEIKDNETRRLRAWELADKAGLSAEDLGQRIRDLRAEREPLEAELVMLERDLAALSSSRRSRSSILAVLSGLADSWQAASAEEKREIARAVADALGGLYVKPAESARLGVIEIST